MRHYPWLTGQVFGLDRLVRHKLAVNNIDMEQTTPYLLELATELGL
jgi:hypothetical protein